MRIEKGVWGIPKWFRSPDVYERYPERNQTLFVEAGKITPSGYLAMGFAFLTVAVGLLVADRADLI